ncbi:MAG TPA: hypothetical protein VLZ74_00345 [Methylocella sp.]|nr:hypothetical protein [Methylocella sp.]
MPTIIGAAEGRGRPGMFAGVGRFAVIGALACAALLGRVSPVEALAPPQAYCLPELTRLSAEWDAIGFGTPQKPSQQIMYGRFGLRSSGPEVRFIRHELRQAFWDCQHGYVESARERALLVAQKLSELW